MGKNWLIVTSVAFGVGFSLSLAVTRQVRTSALIGLVTIPASAAGVFVANRRHQQEVFTGLQAEIRKLERQKETLKRSLQTLQDYQAATQATYAQAQQELDANRQQLQTQLEADQQKHQSLQSDLAALEQQRQTLEQALATTRQQAHDAETQLAELRSQVLHLQAQLAETSQGKATLQEAVRTLETQHQSLTAAIAQLTAHEQALQTQEANLQASLADLAEQRQQLNRQLEADRQERQRLQQDLDHLALRRQELTATTAALDSQLQDMRTQHQALTLTLRQQTEEQSRLEQHLSQLRQQLQTDRQQHDSLTQNLEALSRQAGQLQERIRTLTPEQQQLTSQRDELVAALQQLPVQIEAAQAQQEPYRASQVEPTAGVDEVEPTAGVDEVEPTAGVDEVEPSPAASLEPTIISPEPVRPFRPLVEPTDFRLADPEHTEWLWEEVIAPRWQCPPFLGSVCLPREDTDEVWGTGTIVTIVGQNLRRLGENNLNCDCIYERFDDEDQLNWLKILTFVMSEYAYYMEAESGFWQGLCNWLNLPYQGDNAIPVTTLKQLAEDGIDLLDLPKAVGGYSIVSTLWLQSGIPYRNLHHFADLVADLVDQLGWSAIQNREAQSLARDLLNTCQSNYPGRTVLQRFLAYSYQPDAEPVAGELLQSIASVAIALRDYQQAPEILLNPAQRQEFLVDKVPQFKFFLRDWQALVQILKPDRPVISRRSGQKPLTLRLDVETLVIELVLPAQTLRNTDWPIGVCSIPAVDWQGEIDAEGQIEIEELTQSVEQIAEEWQWQLLDAQATPLCSWEVEGIMPDVPCLIFDAWTGARLLPNPDLTDNPEIFCFVPNDTTIFWDAVEQLEDRVPCSIRGWQGQRLRLAGQSGQLHVQCPDSAPVTLRWQLAPTEPSLRGLHLPGQTTTYLEPPTLWYPPHTATLSLTLTLEERSREEPAPPIQQTVSLPANDRWSPVPLNQWLKQPGQYTLRLSSADDLDWSQRFEVRAAYQVTREDIAALPEIQVTDSQGTRIDLPLTVTESSQFWATTVVIAGVWPLEPVKLVLSNGESSVNRSYCADRNGQLKLDLATLHNLLPASDQYRLDYQPVGQTPQPLVQLVKEIPRGWQWGDCTLHLTGLQADRAYTLIGWNLLTPQHPAREIQVPQGTSVTVTLDVPPGIYYWQLSTAEQAPENLGWWCGSDQHQLPTETEADEELTDYCYTILDNALLGEFQQAASRWPWDKQWIEVVTDSLAAGPHHFPDWLEPEALLAKLKSLLNPVQGQQYTIGIAKSKRGDFEKKLKKLVAEHNLWQLILGFQPHPRRDRRNLAIVTLRDREQAHHYLKQMEDFEWLSREPGIREDA